MISRLSVLAVTALIGLAGCDQMMLGSPTPSSQNGVIGTGTNTQTGALNTDLAATTPQGIVAAQQAVPSQVDECQRLALTIQSSASTEVARQAAIEDRQRIGCPA